MELDLMKMRSLEFLIDSGAQILHVPELAGEPDLAYPLHLKMRACTMANSKRGDVLGVDRTL